MSVLYSQADNVWKLTDFGITTEASSTAITTQFSRGTFGYRAPEILGEHPRFSKKLDIWALGCILIELSKGSPAFLSDFATADHYRGSESPPIYQLSAPGFWNDHLVNFTSECLLKRPDLRPHSRSVCRMLHAYSLLSQPTLSIGRGFADSYLSYDRWKSIVDTSTYAVEVLYKAIITISLCPAMLTSTAQAPSSRHQVLSKLAVSSYKMDRFWLNRLHFGQEVSSVVFYWWEMLLELQACGRILEASQLFCSILRDFPDSINTGASDNSIFFARYVISPIVRYFSDDTRMAVSLPTSYSQSKLSEDFPFKRRVA